MARKDKMSIEEMLAAARAADGSGQQPDPPATSSDSEAAPSEPAPASPPAPVKKAGAMSVEEMLAAARGEKTGDATAPAASPPASSAVKPAADPQKKPGAMSVEEMLAAARGEKSGATAPVKPAKKAVAKPTAKPAASKAAAKASPAKASGPKDTASILAAARSAKQPGPMSKAEAAAQGKQIPAGKKKKLEAPPMPAKPSYAKTSTTGTAQHDRRGFLALTMASLGVYMFSTVGIGFGALIVTNLLWVLGLARFMFPNILTEPPTKFKVGFPDELAPGQVATKFKAQFGVWIVRYEYDGVAQIYALQSVCTHLGCTPNWLEGEQKFKCPCHGSGFYKDGVNFEGPAPRPLERFAIRLADDGQLEVDKSRKYKEEIGQWSDAASYVTV
jgi:cytochrome b6-f complex iron-sulfur subunit